MPEVITFYLYTNTCHTLASRYNYGSMGVRIIITGGSSLLLLLP